jgi:uncharacterized membrane-anchored protein YhcB (DUF1043 family)
MIETIVSMPAISLSLFVVGVICGAVVASIVLPSRREIERLTAELTALKSEHASYKGHVSKHFLKTSELVANMTASYKAVYDHLATGAQSLCSDTEALEAPKFGSPKLIFDPTIEVAQNTGQATEATATKTAAAEPTTAEEPRDFPADAPADAPAATAAEPTATTTDESTTAPDPVETDTEWRLEESAEADSNDSYGTGDSSPDSEPERVR